MSRERKQMLESKLKLVIPEYQVPDTMYKIPKTSSGNQLFLVKQASYRKGGMDDDLSVIEERDLDNNIINTYYYWDLMDINGEQTVEYEKV